MKKTQLKNTICSILFSIFTTIAFANPVDQMNNYINNFGKNLSHVIPNVTTESNVYSDAWIGYFFPSLPLHFAVGANASVTKLDLTDLSNAGKMIGITQIPSTLVFPLVSIDAKIGGLFLPFDIGLSCAFVDAKNFGGIFKDVDINFFAIGTNLRYALLKGDGILPVLSLGAGYYFSKGGVGKHSGENSVSLNYKTHTFVAETQISKRFIFVTPFIGFRGIFTNSSVGYDWKTPVGLMGTELLLHDNKTFNYDTTFIPQLFGGVGLKLAIFQLDLNGSFDFVNSIWNAGASFRLKF